MQIPNAAQTSGLHVLTSDIEPIPGRPAGNGWRVEVHVAKGLYRWVRRYGHKREATAYRPLDELPAARVAAARAESVRQRELKRRAAR